MTPSPGPYDLPENLSEFALIPHQDQRIEELAKLAEKEDWEYKDASSQFSHPILHNYIRYTYRRISEEKKIAVTSDDKFACWNTGLITSHQESLYMLFEENRLKDRKSYWHFLKFAKKSDRDLSNFPKLPDIPHYYEDPSFLVFDTRKELRINTEHIVAENKDRFPENIKKFSDTAIQNLTKGAIDSAIERVKRNYKTAIPQYYRGNVQLLLPLCLTDTSKADLALVIERFDVFYRANTCLTLDMAYNNARQLARPDRDWLIP